MLRNCCLATLAIILCLGVAHANDLYTTFKVVDCEGNPVVNAIIRTSGCVDSDILTPTNGTGYAVTAFGADKSIQYCYGSAWSPCVFEVVTPTPNGLTYTDQSLVLPNGTANANPKQYICQEYNCCHPCNQPNPFTWAFGNQEPTCTNELDVKKVIEFTPLETQCTTSPPPVTLVDVSGETCFAWFPPTYTGTQNLTSQKVVSVSFRPNQNNDEINNIVLTSGGYSLTQSPPAGFAALGRTNRWGWETRWTLPTSTATLSKLGLMYCGQNKPAGTIALSLTATSLTYDINLSSGTNMKGDGIHVYASCVAYGSDKFAPGRLNCNPAKPDECDTTTLTATSQKYSARINFDCDSGEVYTIIHLGV